MAAATACELSSAGRIPSFRIPVRFTGASGEGLGHITNFSKDGMFVSSPDLPESGGLLVLQFTTPTECEITMRSEVRWNTDELKESDLPSGFGLHLRDPGDEYRAFYRWALERAKVDSMVVRGR